MDGPKLPEEVKAGSAEEKGCQEHRPGAGAPERQEHQSPDPRCQKAPVPREGEGLAQGGEDAAAGEEAAHLLQEGGKRRRSVRGETPEPHGNWEGHQAPEGCNQKGEPQPEGQMPSPVGSVPLCEQENHPSGKGPGEGKREK